jgi:hypothetical protein
MARTENAVREGARLIAQKLDQIHSMVDGRVESTTNHLLAANAGIVAANASILLHKSSTEEQFSQTKSLISKQTSAVVQMECIRAYNEAVALRAKAIAFTSEIDDQFDKAVEGVFINRILYDKHFQAIHEEYDSKVRTIGEHIFAIWENDLQPAEQSAKVPHSAFQQLALEVDLERLARRSAQLDQDLEVVFEKSLEPRLDMDRSFERALSSTYGQPSPAADGTRAAVAAIFLSGASGKRIVMDRVAQPAGAARIAAEAPAPPAAAPAAPPPPPPPATPEAGAEGATPPPPPPPPPSAPAAPVAPPMGSAAPAGPEVSTRSAGVYHDQAASADSTDFVERVARGATRRPMTDAELAQLRAAIGRLAERGFVPSDLLAGFDTYMLKVPLQIVEQQEVAV